MLDANHGYDVAEAIALGRHGRRLRHRLVRGAGRARGPRGLRRGAPRPADPRCRRRDLVHALELPRCARRPRRRHRPARHLRRRRPRRRPRRSPTWPRPSACAACRTCGAPASASRRRCSCSPCCRTTRRATRPLEPLLEFDRSEHPFRQAVLTRPDRARRRHRARSPTAPASAFQLTAARMERFAP